MTSLTSKTTLYDFFSVFLPGFITMVLITIFLLDNDVFKQFFNNEFIQIGFVCCIIFFVFSYIIGLSVDTLTRFIFDKIIKFRNNPKRIKNKKEEFDENLKKLEIENNGILYNYYKEYYKSVSVLPIPILEVQVGFCRNMIVVSFLTIFCILISSNDSIFFHYIHKCCSLLIILVLLICLCYVMNNRQNLIYYLIWENEHFKRYL